MMKVFKKPYVYWTISIFLIYLTLNVFLSGFHITLRDMFIYYETLDWPHMIISMFFGIAIAILISINSVYLYIKYKRHKDIKKEGTIACIATIGSLSTGICAACYVSFLPLLMGLFGVTLSWAMLPLQGLEIQFLVLILLIFNLFMLRKGA